jgi:tetratricopeptide (TPR) repeat protein
MTKSILPPGKPIFVVLILLVILILIGGVYLFRGTHEPEVSTNNITTVPTTPTSEILSPISPSVSIVNSPMSPVNIEFSPDDANLFAKAEELFLAGDYLASISLFNRLLEIDPKNEIAFTYRGNAYTELGDYEKAIADYTEAIKLRPDTYPQPYYNRGRIYMLLKEYDKALPDLEKSIELDQYDDINFAYRANGNIGIIYRELGDYEKSLAALDQSIAAAGSSAADAFFLRGETYLQMENYEAAITDYKAAIDRFPQYTSAYQSMGYAYYKTGQLDRANETLNQAVSISVNDPLTYFYLALVALANNDPQTAKTQISTTAKLLANLPPVEQNSLRDRMTTELESFAQENPATQELVKSLINQLSTS